MTSGGRFRGLRVVSFESRRAGEMVELIRRHGGEPLSAPAMREVPLEERGPAIEFALRLRKSEIDVAIFLTGVGTRWLARAIEAEMPPPELGRLLTAITTVVRGPKPAAALRELGVAPTITVPEPNTWQELLTAIDTHLDLSDRRVAVQEYGEKNEELLAGLATRGADVMRVSIYRWALPEDLGPLREAIREILAGNIDVALFTSATQVEHLFQVVGSEAASQLVAALDRIVIASIGPISSQALRRHGLGVDLEPEHPKMGYLVLAAAERGAALLVAKRFSH